MSAPDPLAALLARATSGLRLLTPDEAEAERLERARGEIARLARGLRAQLDPSLSTGVFESLVSAPELRALVARYDTRRGSLLVLGPAGTGKTLSLRRLCRRLLAEAWRVGDEHAPIVSGMWISALELGASLREARLGSTCESMRAAQRAPLLVLDELGQEHHDSRWLLELLEPRYAPRLRPTLTTSGLTFEQLLDRYGVGAVRRLTEPTGGKVDLFGGNA